MASAFPPPSSLATLISTHAEPKTSSSQTTDSTSPLHPSSPYTALALQVQHNLQHQHNWTALTLHTRSPLDQQQPLPRPLLSGLPPARLYVHPDQQAAEIAEQKLRPEQQKAASSRQDTAFEARTGADAESPTHVLSAERVVEREWVLPAHLKEKWSLRQFAEVFDALGEEPPGQDADVSVREVEGRESSDEQDASEATGGLKRTAKRVLFAMFNDDSTINYYIVHDGIVKPRQN